MPLYPSIPHSIRVINPLLNAREWDAELTKFPAATFFHTAAWARVLIETYKHKPVYFALQTSDGARAILPLMEVNSWLTGRRGVSLPFTDECEPLVSDEVAFRRLFREVVSHGKSRTWRFVECRGKCSLFKDAPASISFFGHILKLQQDEQTIFKSFDSSVRRAIRKAEKSAIAIEASTTAESTKVFYELMCLTRQRHGVPPQPFRFFEAIQRNVLAPGHGFIVLARLQNQPVAGAVYFHSAGKAIYKFGASNEAYQHLRANNLVMWEAIKRLAKLGIESLDFGRTSLDNDGLRRFKLNWGTAERKTEYVKYDLKKAAFQTARDSSSGWHTRIFNRMPVFLSRWIGTLLYPHIA